MKMSEEDQRMEIGQGAAPSLRATVPDPVHEEVDTPPISFKDIIEHYARLKIIQENERQSFEKFLEFLQKAFGQNLKLPKIADENDLSIPHIILHQNFRMLETIEENGQYFLKNKAGSKFLAAPDQVSFAVVSKKGERPAFTDDDADQLIYIAMSNGLLCPPNKFEVTGTDAEKKTIKRRLAALNANLPPNMHMHSKPSILTTAFDFVRNFRMKKPQKENDNTPKTPESPQQEKPPEEVHDGGNILPARAFPPRDKLIQIPYHSSVIYLGDESKGAEEPIDTPYTPLLISKAIELEPTVQEKNAQPHHSKSQKEWAGSIDILEETINNDLETILQQLTPRGQTDDEEKKDLYVLEQKLDGRNLQIIFTAADNKAEIVWIIDAEKTVYTHPEYRENEDNEAELTENASPAPTVTSRKDFPHTPHGPATPAPPGP
jgi:hypothetical protein